MKLGWKEWLLVGAALGLMALLGRLDLLAIVAPLSVLVSYGLYRMQGSHRSGQRRM